MLISDAHANHSRKFADFKFVYPVISRRAKGVSIGINCTEVCNYNCIYCQVLMREKINPKVEEIISELKEILKIYRETKFANFFPNIEEKDRVLRDVAFSGNGEPTLYPYFNELCRELEKIEEIPKLVLITNATGIEKIKDFKGEIWGKLDAGTDEWLQAINRPAKSISRIENGEWRIENGEWRIENGESSPLLEGCPKGGVYLERGSGGLGKSYITINKIENNLKLAVSKFKLRIQTMLCKMPSEAEIESYVQIVERVYETNPRNFLGVQLYTVARQAVDSDVSALSKDFLESVKQRLLQKNSTLLVEVF